MIKNAQILDSWPDNLLEELLDDGEIYDRTPDQLAGLRYALTTLTEREHSCIIQRYKDGKELKEIGDTYGVTRERIRQVIAKALRKMRHPNRMAYIRNGLFGEEKRKAALELEQARMRAQLEAVEEQEKNKTPVVDLMETPLEELDLSVRSYNCLRRAGKVTLGGIAAMDYDDLLQVRNLGRRSIDEVMAMLQKYGLRPKKQ